MSLVDRIGTFRGVVTDHAVGVTSKSEVPQWIAQLQGIEYFDDDEKVWVDWSDQDECEITAYLVLFSGKDKETLTSKQIKKVTGWSGKSFTELNNMDLSNVKLQFRVKENNYEGNISMQVEWIDEYDATPGRSVRKLEKRELDELDAKYKPVLTATSGGTTPAKASKKAPPKAPAKPPKRASKPVPTLPEGKSTKDKAWGAVVDLKEKGLSDKQLAETWVEIVEEIVGKEIPDSKITPEQWFLIQEAVLNKTAVF